MANKNDEREAGGKVTQAAATKAETKPTKTAESSSEIWCYIGPSLRGLIEHNKMLRGSRAQVLKQAENALLAMPEAQRLIVAGEELTQSRTRARTPGNALYETYQTVEKKEKEGRKA